MWCIVIRTAKGKYFRETEDTKPVKGTLEYWERTYSVEVDKVGVDATVVNVFEIGD